MWSTVKATVSTSYSIQDCYACHYPRVCELLNLYNARSIVSYLLSLAEIPWLLLARGILRLICIDGANIEWVKPFPWIQP